MIRRKIDDGGKETGSRTISIHVAQPPLPLLNVDLDKQLAAPTFFIIF
jgi:hypothetical protein